MTVPVQLLELRCPEGMGKLLAKVRSELRITDDLIELPCSNCARALRADGTRVLRVLHRFNLLGELVETETVPPDERLTPGDHPQRKARA